MLHEIKAHACISILSAFYKPTNKNLSKNKQNCDINLFDYINNLQIMQNKLRQKYLFT